MGMPRALEALMDSYQEFDIGELQRNFEEDKTVQLLKRPVARYSYALVRAALNVFVQHNFADPLNSLAFDRDTFGVDVQRYVPQVWSYYIEEAQGCLATSRIKQLCELEFKDWRPEGKNQFGAWHRLDFADFQLDVLFQVSNRKGRLGAFEGVCFLDNDQNTTYLHPAGQDQACHHLGPLHLQTVIDEILDALGISPESAISAIKWQMR
ncbi:MAG TPA: hypothetical protein VI566_06550 [Xanthomonadales bacterium]|nr:hypothetical protein [Xanthomonadales bacterium]